jgi:hypothetical protein
MVKSKLAVAALAAALAAVPAWSEGRAADAASFTLKYGILAA